MKKEPLKSSKDKADMTLMTEKQKYKYRSGIKDATTSSSLRVQLYMTSDDFFLQPQKQR